LRPSYFSLGSVGRGCGARARALALGAALAAFGHTNPPASYPAWRSLAALEHHALGETREALELARGEAEHARAWGAPRTLGRALRILGLIEGGSEGIERIREAVAVLEPAPALLEYAYALTNLGAALRRANHRAEARDYFVDSIARAAAALAAVAALALWRRNRSRSTGPRRFIRSPQVVPALSTGT
jgi:hypothetical protein